MASSPLSQWLLPLVLIMVPLVLLFKMKKKREQKRLNLPPGPRGLPIIGNLGQIILTAQSYRELSKKYGPVMLINLGRIRNVVVSSAEAAKEVLKDQDLVTCSRPILASVDRLTFNHKDVAFTPYGEHWRNIRKIGTVELFSLKRVHSYRYIREEETEFLLNSLFEAASSSTPVQLTDKFFLFGANITFKMSFGIYDYRGTEFDSNGFYKVIHDVADVIGMYSSTEYFPYFGWIIDRISGFHAWTERTYQQIDRFFQHAIDEHLKPGRNKDRLDVIDVLLGLEKEQSGGFELNLDNVKGLLLNLFLGGVDTIAVTLNWVLAELIKEPRALKKLQDEIRNYAGKRERLTEDDLEHLPYLQLVLKESLRLHPPAALLVKRENTAPIKICGYDIPAKSIIQVNVWQIGRDPKSWKDPEKFIPERFENSSVDYKGQNFEYLPFGGGRRICPGMNLGTVTVQNALANLLLCFDWKLPPGVTIDDFNLEGKPYESLSLSKRDPVILVPVKYLR